jgi:hypothetical protein
MITLRPEGRLIPVENRLGAARFLWKESDAAICFRKFSNAGRRPAPPSLSHHYTDCQESAGGAGDRRNVVATTFPGWHSALADLRGQAEPQQTFLHDGPI